MKFPALLLQKMGYITFFALHNETEDTLKRLDNQNRALLRIAEALERAYPPAEDEEKEKETG